MPAFSLFLPDVVVVVGVGVVIGVVAVVVVVGGGGVVVGGGVVSFHGYKVEREFSRENKEENFIWKKKKR